MSEGQERLSLVEITALRSLARDWVVATSDGSSHVRSEVISRLLRRVREAFRMDVVFVSEFKGGLRTFQHVDAADHAAGIVQEGAGDPLEESYCQRVVDGRLPRAIPNANDLAEARSLPVTQALPVGAHLSVPIRLHGGDVYGTLCCFSRTADASLCDSDANALQSIADLIAAGVDKTGKLRSQLLLKDIPNLDA